MLIYVFITLDSFDLIALEAGEKLTFNSATNSMGPRKFLHYGNFKKVSICRASSYFMFKVSMCKSYI